MLTNCPAYQRARHDRQRRTRGETECQISVFRDTQRLVEATDLLNHVSPHDQRRWLNEVTVHQDTEGVAAKRNVSGVGGIEGTTIKGLREVLLWD